MRTEEEQIAAIKEWWKENGIKLVAIILVGAVGYFGYQGWQSKLQQEAQAAGDIYLELQDAVIDSTLVDGALSPAELEIVRTVGYLADQLQNEYPDNGYAVLGAIAAARAAADRDDYEEAVARLEWAKGADSNPATQQLVTHRIALAKAAMGQEQQALELLSDADESFAALYAETRGDIYRQLGDTQAAKGQYELAVDSLTDAQLNYQPALEFKLADVAAGLAALSASAATE